MTIQKALGMLALLGAACLLLTGCVDDETHQAVVQENATLKKTVQANGQTIAALTKEKESLSTERDQLLAQAKEQQPLIDKLKSDYQAALAGKKALQARYAKLLTTANQAVSEMRAQLGGK